MVTDGPGRGRYAAVTVGFVLCVVGLSALLFEGRGVARWVVGAVCVAAGVGLCAGAMLLRRGGTDDGKPPLVATTVTLTPAEASSGITKTVTIHARKSCDDCEGTGLRERARCRRCGGRGLRRRGAQQRVVWITPGATHGSSHTMYGLGAPGGARRPAGDLMVTVHIAEGRAGRPAASGSGRNSGRGRDPRIRASHGRPVSDDAFLVTVVGSAGPEQPMRRPAAPAPTGGPVAIRSGAGDCEFAVRHSGIAVRDKWPRPGGAPYWKVRVELSWEDISSLEFDYGSHDSVVSLYATPTDRGGRRHIVDSLTFTEAHWRQLAAGITALSGGRLNIDLTGRAHPGAPRDA